MATTSLEAELTRLVASVPEEAAQPQVRVGGNVENQYSHRHRNLLAYLNRVVASCCPSYLRNDHDDIAQTVLIRLNDKLSEIEGILAACCRLLEDGAQARHGEVVSLLRRGLEEVEKSCDRKRMKKLKNTLRDCLTWAEQSDRRRHRAVRDALRRRLAWLESRGGKEVFAKSYVRKGIHWAILDARKSFIRKAEVSREAREKDSFNWEDAGHGASSRRDLMIRAEISDCLGRLDDAKRSATYLAILGYECSEIASHLELSIRQAESRIRRGKAQLRKCLTLKGVSR